MKINVMTKEILCLAGASFAANAAVSPDRTRIIYNQSDKSVSVRLTNQSPDTPFLAQSWIEDKDNKKSRTYITAIPPMLRLEAGEQAQVRLMGQATLAQHSCRQRIAILLQYSGKFRRVQNRKTLCRLPCRAGLSFSATKGYRNT